MVLDFREKQDPVRKTWRDVVREVFNHGQRWRAQTRGSRANRTNEETLQQASATCVLGGGQAKERRVTRRQSRRIGFVVVGCSNSSSRWKLAGEASPESRGDNRAATRQAKVRSAKAVRPQLPSLLWASDTGDPSFDTPSQAEREPAAATCPGSF